jgi:hypothetical protein
MSFKESVKFAAEANCPLIEKAYFRDNLPKSAILPNNIFEGGLNQAATYRAGAERLFRLKEEGVFRRRFTRRSKPLDVVGLGRLNVSPLSSRDLAQYFRWLILDRTAQEAPNFDDVLAIDALERGSFSRQARSLFSVSFWLQLLVVLAFGLVPLVWALDGLNLVHLTSYGLPADFVAQYHAVQKTFFYVAAIFLGGGLLYWFFSRPRSIFILIVFLSAGGYAIYRHKLSFQDFSPYLNWVVHGGFCVLSLRIASWAAKSLRRRLGRAAPAGDRFRRPL